MKPQQYDLVFLATAQAHGAHLADRMKIRMKDDEKDILMEEMNRTYLLLNRFYSESAARITNPTTQKGHS